MFLTWLQVSVWVFGLGFAAAAPIGPVNMVAIHRGVVGKWSHTLACGLGSMLVDLTCFLLVLLGGQHLLWYLHQATIQDFLATLGALILLPLGVLFLVKMFRYDLRRMVRARRKMRESPPRHLWTDVGTGMLLTIINPATPIYWAGVGAPWVAAAQPVFGATTMWWGLLGAASGLATWFCILTALVRFTPNRLGPPFFRVVNGMCGVMLLVFAGLCIRQVILHHWVQ